MYCQIRSSTISLLICRGPFNSGLSNGHLVERGCRVTVGNLLHTHQFLHLRLNLAHSRLSGHRLGNMHSYNQGCDGVFFPRVIYSGYTKLSFLCQANVFLLFFPFFITFLINVLACSCLGNLKAGSHLVCLLTKTLAAIRAHILTTIGYCGCAKKGGEMTCSCKNALHLFLYW